MKRIHWMILILTIIMIGGFIQAAHAKESVDQYLDRMRMRRDSKAFQQCLEYAKTHCTESTSLSDVSACVPPDYGTKQEAWVSGEWNGTEGIEADVIQN